MNRRRFLRAAGGAALALPLSARGQGAARRPVVGFALGRVPVSEMAGADPSFPLARAFFHGLRDLGWHEGRNVTILRRSAGGRPERGGEIVADLIARGADVIVTSATDWLTDAARQATRTVPIVAIFTEDPVAQGRVRSLARPGGNLTGITTTPGREMTEKRLALLREIAPRIDRVAFLGRRSAWDAYTRGDAAAALPAVFAPVDRPADFDGAFAAVLRERADALLVSHGPVMFVGIPRIVAFAAENRLPALYNWREAPDAGGLVSYGADAEALFRQLARVVDRILRGARAADIPVEQPTRFELMVNLKTAKALGLTVPQSILLRADAVIE